MPHDNTERRKESLQERVRPWVLACFGIDILYNVRERCRRFLEEALELVQACGMTRKDAHRLVDYVFDRPVGEKHQEVGGVMITLSALCLCEELDMDREGERELARIWQKVERIREKQASKPRSIAVDLGENDAGQAVDEEDAIDAETRIENAAQEAASTHSSWEARCHAILTALGLDFGDAPREDLAAESRARLLSEVNRELREALEFATSHRQPSTQAPDPVDLRIQSALQFARENAA